jgi:Domain of unknown function (DUF4405)
MKISRDWATPLTIGMFTLMTVTGVLMFFHLDTGLNKLAHEWLSWVFVVGVALHGLVNWPAFKRHLLSNRGGQALLIVCALLMVGSFVIQPQQGGKGRPGPMLAMRAVMDAPLRDVAPLTGRSAEALLAELRQAGFPVADAGSTLRSATGGEREREAALMQVLFSSSTPPQQP